MRAFVYLAVTLISGSTGTAPAVAGESLITVIDNSHADSVLEIDRSVNVQSGSGTAGSDHDGSAVDMLATLIHTVHPGPDHT
ncbi:hypothetical protein [Streptomyces xanthophaeus]|uniref:hypothetical protein n=1 Tax=Streptomyces xanthophaeus TaxID=67385 RepID=UPI0037229388